jgi:ABC-type Co2+ transport system permease subunit
VLVHGAITALGLDEVTARLPAIVGFWAFCLCLYEFVRRRKGVVFGFVALLLPVVTEAYTYALDARAYGPLLGFCGIALVAWQAAAEDRRRVPALAVLMVSMN